MGKPNCILNIIVYLLFISAIFKGYKATTLSGSYDKRENIEIFSAANDIELGSQDHFIHKREIGLKDSALSNVTTKVSLLSYFNPINVDLRV